MNKTIQHIRYIAAVRQPHKAEDCFQPQTSCFWSHEDDIDKDQIQKFAAYKLKKIIVVSLRKGIQLSPLSNTTNKTGLLQCTNFYSYFSNHLGTWHIKGIHGFTFILVTSENYPNDIAVECIDEFSEGFERVSKTWFENRRAQAQDRCCQAV